MRKKGKFIVIEGGEGSGKGVTITNLINAFSRRSFPCIFTREPGGTRISERIREILLNIEYNEMTPLTELFLFTAARAQHCEQIIIPALKKGEHVICDRFDYSSFAYQIYGHDRKDCKDIFVTLNSIAKQGLEPDLVVYLDVDPVIGLKRRYEAGKETRFDEKELLFHQRVREGYWEQSKSKDNWVVVDASLPEADVKEEVLKIIRTFLKL